MALSINQKRKLEQTYVLLIAGSLLGPLYAAFSDGFHEIHPFISGIAAGFLISLVISLLEIWWLDKGIKQIRFFVLVLLRTIIYIVSITFIAANVLIISRMIRFNLNYIEVLESQEYQDFLLHGDFPILLVYTLVFALTVNFTRMLSRKMGQGMLISYITGTYFKPVKQERIIMFINVANSKDISEKLGPMKFHRFLNDLFFDMTEPVIHHRGIIYEYVEDLVVVTWATHKGLTNANCIRTFFKIKDKLEGTKEKYYTRFGLFPSLKASIHIGNVVRAEIGDVKTQIVLHGDIMNTTARILEKSHEFNHELLSSVHLIYRLELPQIFKSKSIGVVRLKGKEKEIELFNVQEEEVVTI